MLSTISILLTHVETLPLTSVTVNVTFWKPISAHVKELGEALREAIPQLSVEPASIIAPVIVKSPFASKKN